jgi:ribose transport system ATP-binding protein
LGICGLSSKNEYDSVYIKLRPSEILGGGGLLGSGKKALGEILFGVGEHDEGQITVNGKVVEKTNIRKMIQNKG